MELQTKKLISLFESYDAKHILLTGSTGFLGKVLLVMMLSHLPMIKCIYVMIRRKKNSSAEERFTTEVLQSPVFQPLREKHGDFFLNYVTDRIKVIDGDMVSPGLGIDDELTQTLYNQIDVVINVAGIVDFFPDIRHGVDTNIKGTLHLADFTIRCQKASFIHVSTCYVAGKRSGMFEEKVELDTSPNGLAFDAESEYNDLCEHIERLTLKPSRKKFIEFGKERADYWGWNNTYVYTKALSEMLLVKRYKTLNKTIVRPAIVESSLSFPFPGWNEGLNTSAPICQSLSGWYPFFVAKKNIPLDLVPVDEVCAAILMIGAACLQHQASPVYQLATSACNPCTMGYSIKLVRKWHRKNYRRKASGWKNKYLRVLAPIKYIAIDHALSPKNVNHMISKVMTKLDYFAHYAWIKKIRKKLLVMKQELAKLHILYESYLPFCYTYHYAFVANEIHHIEAKEDLFHYKADTLDWKHYWNNIHIPGVFRWIFPEKEPHNPRQHDFWKTSFYHFSRMFFKWYCPLKIEGRQNLPSTPYIIYSNHCSHLDTPVLMLATGKTFNDFSMIAAKDYFFDNHARHKIVNKLMNVISIDRKPTKQSLKADMIMCKDAVQSKRQNLIIYPEGTRSVTGDMQSFKHGIALMAIELGIPLVPVYIKGTYQALKKGSSFPKPHQIKAYIGECIMPTPVAVENRRGLVECYRALTESLETSMHALKNRSVDV